MSREIFQNLKIPICLSTRRLAAVTVDGVLKGNTYIPETDRKRLTQVIQVLESPEVIQLINANRITVGMIKPRVSEGRNLPEDDDQAEKIILGEIKPDKIALRMPFKFTREQAEDFYQLLKEKYSTTYNEPSRYNNCGKLAVFPSVVNFTASGPLTLMLLEGEDIVETWREKMGKTFDPDGNPHTIRGRHGLFKRTPQTIVHGTGTHGEVEREVKCLVRFLREFSGQVVKTNEKLCFNNHH